MTRLLLQQITTAPPYMTTESPPYNNNYYTTESPPYNDTNGNDGDGSGFEPGNASGGSGRALAGGSMGPVLVVVSIIVVLGVVASVLARVCRGRHQIPGYNIERWVERKCFVCIDGSVAVPSSGGGAGLGLAGRGGASGGVAAGPSHPAKVNAHPIGGPSNGAAAVIPPSTHVTAPSGGVAAAGQVANGAGGSGSKSKKKHKKGVSHAGAST